MISPVRRAAELMAVQEQIRKEMGMDDEAKKKSRDELLEMIRKLEKEGKAVIAGFEGLYAADIQNLIDQPTEGLLYDLNRLPEVVVTFIDDPKWINDYAVYQVIKALKERDAALRARLEAAEVAAKNAIELGASQAQEWDRFWKAMGVDSEDVSVDDAIAKYKAMEAEAERLRGALEVAQFGCAGVCPTCMQEVHAKGNKVVGHMGDCMIANALERK